MQKITNLLTGNAKESLGFDWRDKTGSYQADRHVSPLVQRATKKNLELAYILDPICFNGVNQMVGTFLSSKWSLKGPSRLKNEYEDFLTQIEFDEYVLPNIILHACIYGDSFNELVKNKKGNNIVDVEPIDPKTMDYTAEAGKGNTIQLDAQGLPVGFTQKMINAWGAWGGGPGNEIRFKRDDIAHIGMYFVGDMLYPVGVVEPIYKTTARKMNIEEGLAMAAYRHGFPVFLTKLGDPSHEPTPQEIDNVLEKLQNMSYKSELAIPYYYDLSILEPSKIDTYANPLLYFISQQIAGMGVPKGFVTGAEETSNRAALETMMSIFIKRVNWMQSHIGRQIEKQIFKRVAAIRGHTEYPKIEWAPIEFEDLTEKANRLRVYADLGFILPGEEDIAKEIRKKELLPPLPADWKQLQMQKQKQDAATAKQNAEKKQEAGKNANPKGKD